MKALFFLFSIVFIFVTNMTNFAQGKVITREEANSLFGPVRSSVILEKSHLELLLNKTSDKLMFKLINQELYILNSKQENIYSSGNANLDDQVFHVYGISMVNELLEKGKGGLITVEQRDEVLTITSGDYTLEYSQSCPPLCIE